MSTPTPFSKILIANRGEIALRVIRSARSLGYRTVAVHSSADAQALHVARADQAVCIGEPLPAQSYLNIAAIIDAARLTGADAVHPGYGFLAENEDFAAACRDAGLVFIGPSPEAIRAMGDKARAKDIMAAAGVPCIAGYQGEDQGEQRLASEAQRIGYPVMIKATAGGGGRGMRLVATPQEFGALLRSAQSEAKNAFGDATVILERAIVEPRHVEIQVFRDRHGNAVHLGERDCSVQRRHQKIIEEAPSPAVDAALRERMGATALAAVHAIGYEGAGTLEFLLDRNGEFFFMEMNTRLQVEHPVTEAITGLDLVEWQLRVAAGEALPLRQDDIRFSGHAIEVRLCAEDPAAGFLPQSGTMHGWHAPPGLRAEHALHAGAAVPPYYDSMLAKLVAHGRTRDEARRKLLLGVQDTTALGVKTNQDFLARCLAHPRFAAGEATTAFIAQHQDELLSADEAAARRAALVAAWLLFATAGHAPHHGSASRLSHRLPLGMRFVIDGNERTTRLRQQAPERFALGDDDAHTLEAVHLGADEARFRLDGVLETVRFCRRGGTLWMNCAGRAHTIDDRTVASAARRDEAGGDGKVRASTNGRVVAISAGVGAQVSAGQPVIVLEAMKMEHIHTAALDGTVKAVHIAVGEQVHLHRILVEIEPRAGEGAAP